MELSANRRRRPAPNLVPGQKVWLLRRHVSTTSPPSKLDVRRLGPFAIIGPVDGYAFRLDLPSSMHVHHVFHVSLLEPHVENAFSSRVVAPPPPDHVDSSPKFEVERILDSKFRRGKIMYLVDWVGFDASQRT